MATESGRKWYRRMLRHPRWQRKRLELLNLRGFACELCRGTEESLDVHHLSYGRGKPPWDYPLENFVVLCHPCHEEYANRPPMPPLPGVRLGDQPDGADEVVRKVLSRSHADRPAIAAILEQANRISLRYMRRELVLDVVFNPGQTLFMDRVMSRDVRSYLESVAAGISGWPIFVSSRTESI